MTDTKNGWPVDSDRIARGLYWQEAWKLVEGCTHVSAGCNNCWSAAETRVRANHPNAKIATPKQGLIDGKHFNGSVRLREDNIDKPLRQRKPTVYAVWNDLFHNGVPFAFVDRVVETMRQTPWHLFLVLTKRPIFMRDYFEQKGEVKNCWLGVSVEDQKTADERIPLLLQTPAAKRFVSYEPALGAVDFMQWLPGPRDRWEAEAYAMGCTRSGVFLDWLVMGFESGHGARSGHPDWVRKTRDDCKAAGVPFFFKSWGEWAPDCLCRKKRAHKSIPRPVGKIGAMFRCGKKAAGCLLDGKEYKEMPR